MVSQLITNSMKKKDIFVKSMQWSIVSTALMQKWFFQMNRPDLSNPFLFRCVEIKSSRISFLSWPIIMLTENPENYAHYTERKDFQANLKSLENHEDWSLLGPN